MNVTLGKILKAQKTLAKFIGPTPLVRSEWLSEVYNCNVFLKLENMLPIGSFKMRGAVNKISKLSQDELATGVIAISAGNHAQGVAWAAREYKTKAVIFMPCGSPLTKIQATKSLGAQVILTGENFDEAYMAALEWNKEKNFTLVHPFEDEDVIAGQGVIGLEIIDRLEKPDFIIGSIGGGGLMMGVGIAVKELSPDTILIGSQASGANSMSESLRNKEITLTGKAHTFADGIKVKTPSPVMFDSLLGLVDEAYDCSDDEIAKSVLDLIEKARIITEGAGALTLATLEKLHKTDPKRFKGKDVILIICGGNIDVNIIGKIIDKGLVASNRISEVTVYISDKPGELSRAADTVAKNGANIIEVKHNRSVFGMSLDMTALDIKFEAKGKVHLDQVISSLRSEFEEVISYT
jgi:threonine dehydratase